MDFTTTLLYALTIIAIILIIGLLYGVLERRGWICKLRGHAWESDRHPDHLNRQFCRRCNASRTVGHG